MNSPERMPAETHKPFTGYLWVAGIQGKIMSASRPDGWTTAEGPSVRARARLSVRKADAGGGIRRLRQSMEGCHHECK